MNPKKSIFSDSKMLYTVIYQVISDPIHGYPWTHGFGGWGFRLGFFLKAEEAMIRSEWNLPMLVLFSGSLEIHVATT